MSNTRMCNTISLWFYDVSCPNNLVSCKGLNPTFFSNVRREAQRGQLASSWLRRQEAPEWVCVPLLLMCTEHFPIPETSVCTNCCCLNTHFGRDFPHQKPSTYYFPSGLHFQQVSPFRAPRILQARLGKYVIEAVCHKSISFPQLCHDAAGTLQARPR